MDFLLQVEWYEEDRQEPCHTSWLELLFDFEAMNRRNLPAFPGGGGSKTPIRGRPELSSLDLFPVRARRFAYLIGRLIEGTGVALVPEGRVKVCDSLRMLGFPQSSGVSRRARRINKAEVNRVLRKVMKGTHAEGLTREIGVKRPVWVYQAVGSNPTASGTDGTAVPVECAGDAVAPTICPARAMESDFSQA